MKRLLAIALGLISFYSVARAEVFPAVQPPLKDWTIMVYVNAKNDLVDFGASDMNEMEQTVSSATTNVVVEFGRIKTDYDEAETWSGVRRYFIHKDTDTHKINSPIVQDLGEIDMGDYNNLVSFGKWAKERYPAKKYLLIVWNHGSGWVKGTQKGISYDDVYKHHFTTPQLAEAMRQIGKIDLFATDACLMQMAEVVYELKDYADFIVGSEQNVPYDGYDYKALLSAVAKNPRMSPLKMGKTITYTFNKYYQQNNDGSTISLVKTEGVSGFLTANNKFAQALIASGDKVAIIKAANLTQSYSYPENKDLYHFAMQVSSFSANEGIKESAQELMFYLRTNLIKSNKTSEDMGGPDEPPASYKDSHGIAIYLPLTVSLPGYNELQWAKYSDWAEFLVWLNSRP